jgi:hypothetical protein
MRKYRERKNQKIGEEGNDFVLKRYRLEENRHFSIQSSIQKKS